MLYPAVAAVASGALMYGIGLATNTKPTSQTSPPPELKPVSTEAPP